MQLDVLESGAKRLGDRSLGFVFRRVRPGLLRIVASGIDDGRFGTEPLEEIGRELLRFPMPTEFFVDASEVSVVAPAARTAWSGWLQQRPDGVRALHLHASARAVRLTMDIARHEAPRASLVHAYADAGAFARAFERVADGAELPEEDVWTAPAVPIAVESSPRGVVIRDPKCAASIEHRGRGVVRLSIEGYDRGLGLDPTFDELVRLQRRERELSLFVDLSRAEAPRPSVSHAWAAWFALHRPRIAQATLLAPSKAVHLTASIAQWMSRTGELIRIVRDPEEFARALGRS